MIRIVLGIVMVIALGGLIVGGKLFVDYLQNRQFSESNTSVTFVELDPINVSIVKDGELVETRSFAFVIETRAGGPHQIVSTQRPKLRDAYLKYLSSLAQRRGPENIDNLEYVRSQLKLAGTEVFGPNVVYDVLIKSYMTRAGNQS